MNFVSESVIRNKLDSFPIDSIIAKKCYQNENYTRKFYQTIKDSVVFFEGRNFLISERAAFLIGRKLFGGFFEGRKEEDTIDTEIVNDLKICNCIFVRKL